MITYKPEVAQKLKTAADSIERIGQLLPERAQSACSEASAILHEASSEYTPPPPNSAKERAAQVAARAKP